MPSTSSSDTLGKMRKNMLVQTKQKNQTVVINTARIENKEETQASQDLKNASQKEPPKKRAKRNQDIKNILHNIQNRQASLDTKIDSLIEVSKKSNEIQEDRNNILKALINNQNSNKN